MMTNARCFEMFDQELILWNDLAGIRGEQKYVWLTQAIYLSAWLRELSKFWLLQSF